MPDSSPHYGHGVLVGTIITCLNGAPRVQRKNGLDALERLVEQLEAVRDALERCGDLLFGTWDDDQERIAQMRIAEERTRAALKLNTSEEE